MGVGSRIGPAIASVDDVGVKSAKCLFRLASFLDEAERIGRLRFMIRCYCFGSTQYDPKECIMHFADFHM